MRKWEILSNNAIKLLACLFMLIDHMGVILFPNITVLRLIGRMAFPLFAYMFAEGAYYTKNKIKHALILAIFAVIIQLGYMIFVKSYDLSILAIFLISLGLIRLFDVVYEQMKKGNNGLSITIFAILIIIIIGLFYLTNVVTNIFEANYGFYGIMTPLVVYMVKKTMNDKYLMMIALAAMITLKVLFWPTIAGWGAYLSLIFLFFYNGTRGKLKLKYFFYFFYPIHLIILYGISMLL